MLRISQSINRTYRQLKITTDNFNRFVANLKNLLSNISDTETEENAKTHLMDFFKNTYYHPDYLVAQKGRIDFVIHSSKQANAPVAVLFEVKKCNNSTEMITPEELNRKAMQEILLYYLRERIDAKNTELKYLIITNIYEYYIFDAQEFERIFHSNQKLLKEYRSFKDDRLVSSNTDFFYKVIAAKYIEEVKTKIEFTHFDLRDYSKLLDRNDNSENKKILELYKVFSPAHLLKQSFLSDSNSLDKNFYNELLHIMGLEEVADGGKKIIARSSYKNRQEASMIENAINILDAEEHIDKIPNATIYGKSREEQLFNVALELTITWINRVLFLKLLEAQLIRYQKGDKHYGFLNTETISDYDELNRLFFQVLARGYKDRSTSVNEKYAHVPYLNSSLFEVSKLEHRTILMSNLDSKLLLSIPNTTVLKDKKGKPKFTKLTTLEYLFLFLDSYDFASEGEEDVKEDDKALINASVLGLIFEKINGHKDGAVFTPGFITMYICREAIEKTVIRKFNEHYGWECTTIVELHNKINDIAQANHIINSLKICDPAVGSGHFLVSALNEIIRLKYELGILSDINGKRIRDYKVEIINDELVITDDEGATFSYNPQSPESQRVQETLFMEKQTIIENCLFGVDINPNSVKICRLRLWIELLKNAYYTNESEYVHLETLPNIDINIKCGNSLLYRFAFDTDIRQVLRQSGITITEYREAVSGYKNAPNKSKKKEISSMIASIKSTLRTEIAKNEPKFKQLRNKKAKLNDLETPSLFEFSSKEQRIRNKEINNLKEEIRKIELLFEEIKTNRIYLSAFEWRLEFPEVLSDEGDFIGFDCIIGNPPYIQLQKMGADADVLQQIGYKTFVKTGDLFCLFYELGITLLKKNGLLAYITSNTWLRAGYGESLRRFLLENSNVKQLIDFSEFKVFDSATVRANILFAESSSSEGVTQACVIYKATFSIDKLSDYCKQNLTSMHFKTENSWIVLSPIEKRIKEKIEKVGKPLKNWDINIYRGILTGYNEAFIIDKETKDRLIEKSSKNAEIIRPILRGRDIKRYKADFADLWIIATFPSLHYNIDNYPDIKEHLLSFGYDRLKQTGDNGARKKTNNQWFETQDSISYWEDFSKQKIIYPNMTKSLPFFLDVDGYMVNQKCFIVTGNNIGFLSAFFNSSLFKFCFRDNFPELFGNTRELSKIFFDRIPVIEVNSQKESQFRDLVLEIQKLSKCNKSTKQIEVLIDEMIFDLYDLSTDERETIGFIDLQ